jgi:hypothetical protein
MNQNTVARRPQSAPAATKTRTKYRKQLEEEGIRFHSIFHYQTVASRTAVSSDLKGNDDRLARLIKMHRVGQQVVHEVSKHDAPRSLTPPHRCA